MDLIGGLLVQHQTGSGMPEHGQYPDRDLWLSSSSWPQRAVLQTLTTLVVPPLNINHRGRLEEHLNQLLRLLETLENLRDRIDILSDQAKPHSGATAESKLLCFAVVSTIFCP